MSAFPPLDINTAALIAEVERLLVLARVEPGMGAVNWSDLGVVDVEYRLSMLRPEEGPSCVVMVEEADPWCAMATWINQRLAQFPLVRVECEW